MDNQELNNDQQPALKQANVSGSSTNSPLGSYHWFHTIVARQKSMGEYLKEKTPTEEVLRAWGKQLYEDSKELLLGYTHIGG